MEAVGAAGRTMSIINGRPCGVELNEWEKDGWTYHAKGDIFPFRPPYSETYRYIS